ncbi:RAD55 family ATPase [Halospeciosus flavus]|uniref:RAD55 family ATPase n=1 Tax=Halospeciosus flavus TaxID=3032283 RepID=A0ABD5Z3Y4_9EURY|nr:recombinase RecA [Halospeciosus flavus]
MRENATQEVEMYDVSDTLPVETIPPGTNLLVAGPPMSGKEQIAMDILERGCERGEGALVVTCRDSANRLLSRSPPLADAVSERRAGIVDCVTRQRGEDVRETESIRYVASPSDVTDIGIRLTGLLQSLSGRSLPGVRSSLVSIPTLLMYADTRRVFRFLHVLNGRIQSQNYLGLGLVELSDRDTFDKFAPLYDGMVQIREEGGRRELRVVGLGDGPSEWSEY